MGDREGSGRMRPPWTLNPLRSEGEAFAALLWVVAFFVLLAIVILVVRAL